MIDLKDCIRDIPDFPKKGILFKDITPLLNNSAAFSQVIDSLVDRYKDKGIDKVVAAEARGFLLGSPVACGLGAGFVGMIVLRLIVGEW